MTAGFPAAEYPGKDTLDGFGFCGFEGWPALRIFLSPLSKYRGEIHFSESEAFIA